jgi:hypothetical protein
MVSSEVLNRKIAKSLYPAGQGQCYILRMGRSAISKYLSAIAKRGGEARAESLTSDERKAIAIKASKAAAKARTRKAKLKKSGQGEKWL